MFASFALAVSMTLFGAENGSLRVAVFNVDATPPIGTPVAYAPARKILDPLSARGVVLLGAGDPIVLCAVDWIGIANGGHDRWRQVLADAAQTSPDRVSVHALHQHDAPRCDFTAEEILAEHGLGGRMFSPKFCESLFQDLSKQVKQSLQQTQPVTHYGIGKAKVEKVASNRRILGPDGKVAIVRFSKSTNPKAIEAPEGLIDPYVRVLSFWNNERPVVAISYYATHPQSYYGLGDVSCEFVGIARNMRDEKVPGVLHVHFNGASGNVAAGKYNDGSPELRPILAQRLEDGMRRAWEATEKAPITPDDVSWRTLGVKLPLAPYLNADKLSAIVRDKTLDEKTRIQAASKLAFTQRINQGHEILLGCLRIGNVRVLHMPGELFVEYQLAAQQMLPDKEVCMAAYGDYGTGYIGTEIAYWQGGYETSERSSKVAPNVERVLTNAMKELLDR